MMRFAAPLCVCFGDDSQKERVPTFSSVGTLERLKSAILI
jgi:hypothetical protein